MRTILVTGGTGFLGRAVVNHLMTHPDFSQTRIRLLVRNRQKVIPLWRVEIKQGDLLDPTVVREATSGCDSILHLAGLTYAASPRQYHRVNTEGTQILIEAAQQHGIRRLLFASTWAIDPSGGGYSASKRTAEALIAKGMDDFLIVRLPDLYGEPGSRGVGELITWMQRHRWIPLIGAGDQALSPLHVEDAAVILVRLFQTGSGRRVYALTGPEQLTFSELVDSIAHTLQTKPRKVFIPFFLAQAGIQLAAVCFPRRFGYDQVSRLVSPKPDSNGGLDILNDMTWTLRRFSEELPKLVFKRGPRYNVRIS
ncbi:MAG: NAD-dependent epimerase/dehydratase family protein [Candidatus Omnitrophica bacterium]|nr:NAD-dependent epimerase/dehydratase family protein [Candidatus Omnitrophota bacterium]